jgi:predicted restriction endonuclease
VKRDKYDIVFSKLIRAMAGNRCEYCRKKDGQIDCAHIFGRRHRNTRWDIENAVALCRHHHRYFTERPVDFVTWLENYKGKPSLDELRVKAHQVKKWTKEEKEEMYLDLKARLEKLSA